MTEFRKVMLIAALFGVAGLAVGLWIDPKTALASYLVAWTAIGAIPIGALAVLFTTYLVRAGWTHDLHGLLSGAALTAPAVAVLFIPVLAGMTHIYPWATEAHLPSFKAVYLTPWFFVLRTVFYFAVLTALAVWGALAYGDETAMKRSASAGLIVWALVASWAGIDWLESLEPQFHSSIYGLLKIGFDLLAGFGFAVAALLLTRATRLIPAHSFRCCCCGPTCTRCSTSSSGPATFRKRSCGISSASGAAGALRCGRCSFCNSSCRSSHYCPSACAAARTHCCGLPAEP